MPASIAEELADGLTETYESCLSRGLPPSAAAEAAVAGCFGYAALDATLIIAAAFLLTPVGWVTAVAMTASAARIAVTARLLRPARAR